MDPLSFSSVTNRKELHVSPFVPTIGIYSASGRPVVVYDTDIHGSPEGLIPEVIHELGHICTVGSVGDTVYEHDFLGWEYFLAKRIEQGPQWWNGMHNFSVGHTTAKPSYVLGQMSAPGQQEFLEKCIERSIVLGFVVNEVPQRLAWCIGKP